MAGPSTQVQRGSLAALWTFAAIGVAYLGLVTAQVLVEVWSDCIPYYDLGIYTEGILRLGWGGWNPRLSARHLTLFSDHFDPVVWLAAPVVQLLPVAFGSVVFEALTMLLGCAPWIWLYRSRELSLRGAALMAVLVLFNAGATTAVHEPIHPTTWAMVPWIVMVVALELRAWAACFVAFVVLMACKEEFPFVGYPLGLLLLALRQRRWASLVVATATAWLGFVYGLRPLLVGEVVPYYGVPFAGLDKGVGAYLVTRLTHPDLLAEVPLYLLPLMPLAAWLWRTHRALPHWGYLLLPVPPLAIRFLSMQWRHQYHAVTVAALTLAFLPALRRRAVPRWLLGTTCALLLAVNAGHGRDALAFVGAVSGPKLAYCAPSAGRSASLAQGRALVRAQTPKRLLVGMNLLAKLVDLPNTFVLDMPDDAHRVPYEVVFFEKPPMGADWPLTQARLAQLIERWRSQPTTQVLLDDAHVFVAVGQFLDT